MKGEVKLPVHCTVRALAVMGNVTEYLLAKLLRECDVRRVRVGTRVLIPLAEIEKKISLLFESLKVADSMRRRREQGQWR